jgi:iron complex transport system permease protein
MLAKRADKVRDPAPTPARDIPPGATPRATPPVAAPTPPPRTPSRKTREGFPVAVFLLFAAVTLAVFVLCVAAGSVGVPLGDTLDIIMRAVTGTEQTDPTAASIILTSRLPRVVCVAFVGAALALCGCAMQGLLKNPLADGSTLGVSSGAALGAVIAIAFGVTIPVLPFAGTVVMAIGFAFLSLLLIVSLAYKLDYSLSTNTIILIGVVFAMFVSSILQLVITFSKTHVAEISFWLMGSLAGSTYGNALMLAVALVIGGTLLVGNARELNAFALGEDNARHVGVNVGRVKLIVLVAVSVLIGVSVSVGGAIGFVGLVTPHILRMIVGPNHWRLMPASLFGGACFLMLADLVARVLLSPLELRLGIVTSFVGAILFVYIFYTTRKVRA